MRKATVKPLFYCKRFLAMLLVVLSLAGCAVKNNLLFSQEKLLLAQQLPEMRFEQEAMIERLGQLLLVAPLQNEELAILHFERATLFDSLGLWTLAQYDFAHSLVLQPQMAGAYNYLGLYLLLAKEYEDSLEAFNRLLELEPDYEYGYLNRGLNFYYTQRYHLAQKDFEHFYQSQPSDPYRVLWLYFNEIETQPQKAMSNLSERANSLDPESWGTQLVQYFLGKKSLTELLKTIEEMEQPSASYAEVLTETYFYLAKQKLKAGNINEAMTLFKLAAANQVYNFVEYRFALFELSQLANNSKQGAVAQ